VPGVQGSKEGIVSDLVCRIQDNEGRGPYRPGFSHIWSERQDGPDPVFIAFPSVMRIVRKQVELNGGAVGCAFRNLSQARNWFSPNEILKLALYGYALVWMEPDKILAENDEQLVFWKAAPLRNSVIRVGWREGSDVRP
jgi:hypothetical protein